MDKFNPNEDAIDRRIYYGVTNKKIDPTDRFSDESDEGQLTNQTTNAKRERLARRSTFDHGKSLRQLRGRKEEMLNENAPLSPNSPEY